MNEIDHGKHRRSWGRNDFAHISGLRQGPFLGYICVGNSQFYAIVLRQTTIKKYTKSIDKVPCRLSRFIEGNVKIVHLTFASPQTKL